MRLLKIFIKKTRILILDDSRKEQVKSVIIGNVPEIMNWKRFKKKKKIEDRNISIKFHNDKMITIN